MNLLNSKLWPLSDFMGVEQSTEPPPPPVDEAPSRSQVDEPSTPRRLRPVPPPPLGRLLVDLMHFDYDYLPTILPRHTIVFLDCNVM